MADDFTVLDTPEAIDVRAFWRVLGERASGVSVVTARSSAGPAGFLALSATHVSASPPTMLVSIDRKTEALAAVEAAGHFAVNYLPAGSAALADMFGGKTEVKGAARFAEGDWMSLKTGAPVLTSALSALDCQVEKLVEVEGTIIAIGRVVACFGRGTGNPLVLFRGKYQELAP